MKKLIIIASVVLSGCAGVYKDPCVNIDVKGKMTPHKEVKYGWTKAELEAMPSWCGYAKRHPIIVDRTGRVIGTIR